MNREQLTEFSIDTSVVRYSTGGRPRSTTMFPYAHVGLSSDEKEAKKKVIKENSHSIPI